MRLSRSTSALVCAVLLPLLGLGCRPDMAEGPAEGATSLGPAEVVVSTESGRIGFVSDLALLSDGTVVAADRVSKVVLLVSPEGGVSEFGRAGEGPGEFQAPSSVGVVEGDSIAVWDPVAGRVQVFSADGGYARSYSVQAPDGVAPSWDSTGRLAAPTLGMTDALVRVFEPTGTEIGTMGQLLAPASAGIDFGAGLEDLRRGVVPSFARNAVRVVWGRSGSLWLVPQADPTVMQVGLDGAEVGVFAIEDVALDAIREGYFEAAAEPASRGAIRPLRYYADAERVGDEVWLLVSHESAPGNVILALPETGGPLRRLVVPYEGRLGGFVVDPARGRLVVVATDLAQMLSFPIRTP